MSADIEILKGGQITYGKSGYRVERVAIVSGVTGNADSLLFEAINDSQLPRYGDPHPTVPGITLQNIVAEPLDGDQYRVVMSYFDDGTNSRVSGGIAVEDVSTDVNGDRMVTKYGIIPDGGSIQVEGIGFVNAHYFTAAVERPRITFDFTYNSTRFPKDTIDTYLGKINSASWNDYPEKTILLTAVNVDQVGDEYRVRISLAHNEETWDFQGVVSDGSSATLVPHATDPDPLLDLETGIRPFEVYEQVDFSPLGLVL